MLTALKGAATRLDRHRSRSSSQLDPPGHSQAPQPHVPALPRCRIPQLGWHQSQHQAGPCWWPPHQRTALTLNKKRLFLSEAAFQYFEKVIERNQSSQQSQNAVFNSCYMTQAFSLWVQSGAPTTPADAERGHHYPILGHTLGIREPKQQKKTPKTVFFPAPFCLDRLHKQKEGRMRSTSPPSATFL